MKAWEVPMKGTTNKLWNESRASIQSQDMWYERNGSDKEITTPFTLCMDKRRTS